MATGAWFLESRRKTGMRRIIDSRGFTLIEIMVVVVILGILAGIVVPRLLDRPEEARRTKAAVQIKSLEEALGLFKLDNGFYPSTEQGLEGLVSQPETGRIPTKYRAGGYIKKVPLDPWGNPYIYLSPGANGDFDLISYGPDGESGGEGENADIESWNID
jgi:general secretion pathway protein G